MKFKFILCAFVLSVLMISCDRRENDTYDNNVIKEWNFPLAAMYQIPGLAGRTDSAKVHLVLLANNSLRYDINIPNLKSGDAMTGVTLNAGNPITNGPALLNLAPRIGPRYITGGVFNLRQTLVDSLIAGNADLYVNITSAQQTAGLLRGPLNTKITLASDVRLTGAEEVPPTNTTSTGVAVIRVTSDRKVYSRVTLANVEPNDQFTAAHIHRGTPGVNGPVLVPLASSAADFGQARTINIDETTYNALMTNRLYVNAHSTLFPAGKIRGQLK